MGSRNVPRREYLALLAELGQPARPGGSWERPAEPVPPPGDTPVNAGPVTAAD
jgi:hypothetical protein